MLPFKHLKKEGNMVLVTVINKNLDSLIPIIFEFRKKITKHILVYDEAYKEKKIAKKLKHGIKEIEKLHNKKIDIELIEVDEDSKNDIVHIEKKLNQYDEKLYLNATHSDLSLVVVLSGFILQNGGSVFAYDSFDNSYNEIDKKGFQNHTIQNNLKLQEYFLYNSYTKISANKTEHLKAREASLNYIFKTPQKLFLNHHILRTKQVKYIEKHFKEALISLNIIDNKLNFTKEHKGFGTLFEEFIYLKLQQYNFDDIMLGVEVMFDDNLEILNEFDILAIKNNHIIVVECKWGNPSTANEVIYKLDSIMENFGIDAKGFIVNIQQNFDYYSDDHNFVKKIFSKKSHSRATYNNLEIYNDYLFNESSFNELIYEFLEVHLKEHKKMKDQSVFLLGGCDLEMIEIKKLLTQHSQPFVDKKLLWGAKLSFYADILNDKTTYYGVELVEDITPPKNYITIDHHNQLQEKESSLEQIAKILDVELSRYQKLVALNDSGYIPAMEKFGATEVEIALIREKDRESQGAKQEDELLAQISIENAQKIDNIFVVEAQTPYFSTIVDKLYAKEKNILIYNNSKLVYYGAGIKKLVNIYKKDIKKKRAYYGGNYGFFGFASKTYNLENILTLKTDILKRIKI